MERQYVASERAHFMCPNMHFGILCKLEAESNPFKTKNCLDIMAKAHPFLRSTLRYEHDSTKLYYQVEDSSKVELIERKSILTIWKDYEKIANKEWNVFQNGLLKVFLYPIDEGMQLLFVAHHLLGDGRCLLELVNEFVNLYIDGITPVFSQERLIQGIKDLPARSELKGISKYLVRRLNAKWREEKTYVSYEMYANFSNQFVKKNPVSHEVMELDTAQFSSLIEYCKKNDITVNDLLMAQTYDTMQTKKIIIAADIRSKLSCYQKGACGNYATAMGIVYKGKNKDIATRAKSIHRQVKSHMASNRKLMLLLACYLSMDEGLIDAAAIASLGDFESGSARFVGGSMFGFLKRDGVSITNLGNIHNQNINEAVFIPPASPAMAQTLGVLTVNDKMNLCSSYYQNLISAAEVKSQLPRLVEL